MIVAVDIFLLCRAVYIYLARVTADTMLCCIVVGHDSRSWCQVAKEIQTKKLFKSYSLLFRTFMDFVIHMKVNLSHVNCSVIL